MGFFAGLFRTVAHLLSHVSSVLPSAAAPPAPPISPPGAPLIRVLTLNFNSETHDRGIRDLRFGAMVDWIRRYRPDIVLIQEGWDYAGESSVAKPLARAVGYDLAYRLDMGAPVFGYDSDAVLARKCLRMSDERDIKLEHSAWTIGNGKSWIVVFGRVSYAVGVRLELPDGKPLFAYSTHLIATSADDRRDQLEGLDRKIRDQVEQSGESWATARVLVGGDMNSTPDSAPSAFMRDAGYEDTWMTAHPGQDLCTFCSRPDLHYFNPFAVGGGMTPAQTGISEEDRLDYIYVRGSDQRTLAATQTFTLPYDGIWMSDHYAQLTTIALSGAPPAVPNPLRDSPGDVAPATVLEATPGIFKCGDDDDCSDRLPDLEVRGARGLTIVNRTDDDVRIRIRGPGRVYTSDDVEVGAGEAAAFSFDRDGDYAVTLDDENDDTARGTIHVSAAGYFD